MTRIITCTVPGVAERQTTGPRKICTNANNRARTVRGKLPFILATAFWVLLVGIPTSCALPFTQALPTTDVDVGAVSPVAVPGPAVQAPSAAGEAPSQPVPTNPTPVQPATQILQFQQVLYSLRANNYTIAADYVLEYLFLLPLGSTLFVPSNAALGTGGVLTSTTAQLGTLFAYHAITQQLSNQQISLLPVGSQFGTMASSNTVVVTTAVPGNIRIDNVHVVQGDMCTSTIWVMQISCYGADGIMNMTEWGNTSLAHFTASPLPSPSGQGPSGSPSSDSDLDSDTFKIIRLVTTFLLVILHLLCMTID